MKLRRTGRGAVLVLVVTICFLVLIVKAVQQATAVLETIMLNGGMITIGTITEAVNRVVSQSEFKVFLFCIGVCWIFSIFDAYSIGREQDIKARYDDRQF